MITRKERLTVTVDPHVVEAGHRAVAAGLADSLSGWVNGALVAQCVRDTQLQALGEAIQHYEAEHGVIAADEIEQQERRDRETAVIVRGPSGAE